jgi:hypothetical protein
VFYEAKRLALACGLLASAAMANAADITHRTIVDDIEGIVISGEISSPDTQKFRQISTRYPKAVVILSSNGGSLLPAIEIGKIIKIAGYVTLVPDKAICASSCALIWVAGTTRFMAANGRVGFHASYRDNNGKLEESGVANALIGNYLTLLNLSERAIIFATRASPDGILWLTKANKTSAGIDFEDFDFPKEKATAKEPLVIQAPPILRVEAPPAKAAPSTQPAFKAGQDKADGEWIVDPHNPDHVTYTDQETGEVFHAYKDGTGPWTE